MGISEIGITNYGKRISLEMGTELQVQIADVAMPLYSCLVGMDADEFLIIKAPSPYQLVKQKLYKGNELIVKYLYNGTIYAFQSKLIDAISKPFRLVFLEHPKIIEKHELRSARRARCFFPAHLVIGTETYAGIILDISRQGCRLQIQFPPGDAPPPFRLDEQIRLLCKFPGIEGDVEILGALRNIKRSRQEATLGLGFSKTTPEAINRIITDYIFSIFKNH